MKKLAMICTIITIAVMIATACALPATAETADTYELDAIVIGWDETAEGLRAVDCLAEDGNIWTFYDDAEEWDAGDRLILIMHPCTADPFDDEIIDVIWTEYLEPAEMGQFLWAMKW